MIFSARCSQCSNKGEGVEYGGKGHGGGCICCNSGRMCNAGGGGGGGYGTAGQDGGSSNDKAGFGGHAHGDPTLIRIYHGSGGGSGGDLCGADRALAGANGGGIIMLFAREFENRGTKKADGQTVR